MRDMCARIFILSLFIITQTLLGDQSHPEFYVLRNSTYLPLIIVTIAQLTRRHSFFSFSIISFL